MKKQRLRKLTPFTGIIFIAWGCFIVYLSYKDFKAQAVSSRAGDIAATMQDAPIEF